MNRYTSHLSITLVITAFSFVIPTKATGQSIDSDRINAWHSRLDDTWLTHYFRGTPDLRHFQLTNSIQNCKADINFSVEYCADDQGKRGCCGLTAQQAESKLIRLNLEPSHCISFLVVDDQLLLANKKIQAFDLKTTKLLWQHSYADYFSQQTQPDSEGVSHSKIRQSRNDEVPGEKAGDTYIHYYVSSTGAGFIAAHDRKTGKQIAFTKHFFFEFVGYVLCTIEQSIAQGKTKELAVRPFGITVEQLNQMRRAYEKKRNEFLAESERMSEEFKKQRDRWSALMKERTRLTRKLNQIERSEPN